jgi:phage terminase large subunit GpA-like protein
MPEPDLTVSEWADEHRLLDQASSSEPGRWRTDRTPYLREIMDSLSASDESDIVVFQKGAQIGASEGGINFVLYAIHHAPAPMLYVLPTVDAAKRVSKQRIAPAIEAIPAVKDKVATPRARDSGNTLFQKDYPGGTLIMTGSNSAVGLRSMPARYLFLDEVDGFPQDLDGEGSPIQLAVRRTATFKRNRKIFMVSTPTVKGLSTIEEYYEQSDQRRYFVPCPECCEMQPIEWEQIVWDEGDPESAQFACKHCGALSSEAHKTNMLNAGQWRPTAEGRYRGYHLSSLYSPAGWYSWGDAAADFISAKHAGQEQLKTFVNTVLGRTWEELGEQIDPTGLIVRREEYPADLQFKTTTVAVDVQKDRLELEHVGWDAKEESWGLEYIVLPGDTAQGAVWDDLTATLNDLKPDGVVIDSGYNTQLVYDYVAKRRFCWAIKGQSGMGLPLIQDAQKRAMRLRKRRQRAVTPEPIGVDQGKAIIMSRLQLPDPGPGYMHFPAEAEYDDEYFAQLTAEKLVTRYTKGRPRQEWVQTRPRNEALDVRVYGLACLRLLGNKTTGRAHAEKVEKTDTYEEPKKQKKPRKTRGFEGGGAWL